MQPISLQCIYWFKYTSLAFLSLLKLDPDSDAFTIFPQLTEWFYVVDDNTGNISEKNPTFTTYSNKHVSFQFWEYVLLDLNICVKCEKQKLFMELSAMFPIACLGFT